ncbi:MAG TPA: hypothetical protein ENF54_05540 [Desulfobacteraceae bacterium]|nr:hypothetical protein [Desulfobacteraceae bacterium]
MDLESLLHNYEYLLDDADRKFKTLSQRYKKYIRCEMGCSDCCHAVFGLFLIEAVYIKRHFDKLDPQRCKEALLRCNRMDIELKRIEKKIERFRNDPEMQNYVMAKERIRCPLLDENNRCILYPYRPITCRVYGVPVKMGGTIRVCHKAKFEQGMSYSFYDLDDTYRNLYLFSVELLKELKKGDQSKASLLISMSKALGTPFELLIDEFFS